MTNWTIFEPSLPLKPSEARTIPPPPSHIYPQTSSTSASLPSFTPQPPMEAARIAGAAALRKSMSTTVYMEMRLSLQKLLFANHPFAVRRSSSFSSLLLLPLRSHDEAKRGWWYDSDLRILPTTTTPWLTTFHRHHLCVWSGKRLILNEQLMT